VTRKQCILGTLAFLAAAGFSQSVSAIPQRKAAVESPASLVASLYKIHNKGNGPLFEKKGRPYLNRYFDTRLAQLIWKNVAETPEGEIGNLDFDPLFNAQDLLLSQFKIGEPRIAGQRATLLVSFKNDGRLNKITYSLRKTPAGWRIQNLDYGEGQNLVTILSTPL